MMPFISLPAGLMGILSLFSFSPETAKPLRDLAEVLLRQSRNESSLTPGQRELIAAFVSRCNDCTFCCNSHTAAACHQLGCTNGEFQSILQDPEQTDLPEKLKALLQIARKVCVSGKAVLQEDIDRAKAAGATDQEIHDTILIAAAFCMFNRYVDGLGTASSPNPADYGHMGKLMAESGYVLS